MIEVTSTYFMPCTLINNDKRFKSINNSMFLCACRSRLFHYVVWVFCLPDCVCWSWLFHYVVWVVCLPMCVLNEAVLLWIVNVSVLLSGIFHYEMWLLQGVRINIQIILLLYIHCKRDSFWCKMFFYLIIYI